MLSRCFFQFTAHPVSCPRKPVFYRTLRNSQHLRRLLYTVSFQIIKGNTDPVIHRQLSQRLIQIRIVPRLYGGLSALIFFQ